MKFEIREIKKHSIDTYDIWVGIHHRIHGVYIKNNTLLNDIIKEEIDKYLELYGIDKNNVSEEDYKRLFNYIREGF